MEGNIYFESSYRAAYKRPGLWAVNDNYSERRHALFEHYNRDGLLYSRMCITVQF